ncbi:MAG: hypothetical protein OXR73_09955 [Myxococcales bacterium]|nr:hypothetical protein [Myxococcales bacterium]
MTVACVGSDQRASGGSARCATEFSPCGGDVVGTWALEDMCIDGDLSRISGLNAPECSDAVAGLDLMPDATYVLSQDRVEVSGQLSMIMTMVISDACVGALASDSSARAEPAFCARLEDNFNSAPSDSTIEGGTCRAVSGACECEVRSLPREISASSGYRIQGNSLVDDAGNSEPYCVSGDTLQVRSGSLGIEAQIVLKRR